MAAPYLSEDAGVNSRAGPGVHAIALSGAGGAATLVARIGGAMARFAIGVFCALGLGGCLAAEDEAALDASADAGVDAGAGGAAVEAAHGTLQVSPEALDFGRVAPVAAESGAAPVSLTLTLSNVGGARLAFDELSLHGSPVFQVFADGRDLVRAGALPALEPGASVDLQVTVAPWDQGPLFGELRITSSDPERPEIVVPLQANATGTCVRVTPVALDFEASRLRRPDNRSIRIGSCGVDPLRIERLELTADTDPAFTLDAETVAALPLSMPGATPDAPDPGLDVQVNFDPHEARDYTGALRVHTNDPETPVIEVSLAGRGAENACPVAVATPTLFEVPVLDVVVLDGTFSFDPDPDPDDPDHPGRPWTYEWVITERPEGSTSQPQESLDPRDPTNGVPDDATTPISVFFVDLVGHYTAELRVADDEGASSDSARCRTSAIVTIVSLPTDELPP